MPLHVLAAARGPGGRGASTGTGRWARRPPLGSRRMMLQALEDYIGALEALRLPVPYALRDELRLHQQLFDR